MVVIHIVFVTSLCREAGTAVCQIAIGTATHRSATVLNVSSAVRVLLPQEAAVENFRRELEARNAWRREDHGEKCPVLHNSAQRWT